MAPVVWTAEMDAIIRSVAEAGGTATEAVQQIRQIGHIKTRSAVIGRSQRTGARFKAKVQVKGYNHTFRLATPEDLIPKPKPPKPERKGGTKLAKAAPKVERKGGSRFLSSANKGNFNPIRYAPGTKEAQQTPAQRRLSAAANRETHLAVVREMEQKLPGVPFMVRRQSQCVSMFGSGMHANCCGKPVTFRADGNLSSYCAEHHALYHQSINLEARKRADKNIKEDGVLRVKPRDPASEDEEQEEEIVPVDAVLGAADDDDSKQAA